MSKIRMKALCKKCTVLFSCPKLVKGVFPLGKRQRTKMCFSKKLLIADYLILVGMLAMFLVPNFDTSNWGLIVVAWVAQIAISTGAYYWKAKAENLVKLPIAMLNDIPEDMREKTDPNQIVASVLGIGTHNNSH